MPIFQDDLGGGRGTPPKKTPNLLPDEPLVDDVIRRKASEESIRTDLCDGPLPDSPDRRGGSPEGFDGHFVFPTHGTFDRVELIKRLKGAQSPTWLPNRHLESIQTYDQGTPARRQSPGASKSSPLLPPAEISEPTRPATSDAERVRAGLEIERPRSALHSGDFTEIARQSGAERTLQGSKLSLFDPEPQEWLSTSPPRDYNPFQIDTRFPSADPLTPDPATRDRAPSLSSSYSSSFVFKPPTSPLVQSESNEDLELSSFVNPIDITSSAQRHSRRHTLQAPHSMHSTPSMPGSSISSRPLPNLRRDNTYPYQAHQPRRSLTLNPVSPYPSASPQTPGFLRSRRPSYTSESSSLHASMVGSYEESILRGRMSTTPSKPLDFVAQIGVLGLGKCKASLKCPPHVTIPFPAVFYSYETTTHGRVGKMEDGPSPYVGQVDLENGLASTDEPRHTRKKLYNGAGERKLPQDIDQGEISRPNTPGDDLRKAEKQKRGSTSPRAPPGGSYRIPEKGQLQIIIKNPNKTAVKLFLVPYDLAGMEPGTKTFIRQRSYSAGPIIDSALSSSAQPLASSPLDRPTLRYLVHLHICCVGRGRYFLYKSIRVVFANRVPDGKEKLRNEISLPEPRFSAYKPGRESGVGAGAGALLAAEKAFRRRSSGFALGPSHRTYESMDGNRQALDKGPGSGSGFPYSGNARNIPIEPIPFQLSREHRRSEAFVRDQSTSQILSPTSSKSSGVPTPPGAGLLMSWNSGSPGINGYGKLAKGDIGYGGNAFSGSPDGKQGVAEGLLAKKLRKLGVGLQNPQDRLDGV